MPPDYMSARTPCLSASAGIPLGITGAWKMSIFGIAYPQISQITQRAERYKSLYPVRSGNTPCIFHNLVYSICFNFGGRSSGERSRIKIFHLRRGPLSSTLPSFCSTSLFPDNINQFFRGGTCPDRGNIQRGATSLVRDQYKGSTILSPDDHLFRRFRLWSPARMRGQSRTSSLWPG